MNENHLITVFGASISEQKGPEGYLYYLRDKLKNKLDKNIDINIDKMTFPSANFSGAGFFYSDYVCTLKSKIVIMDWLSTSENEFEIDKLTYVITRFLRNGIYPIIVDLPRADSLNPRRYNSLQASEISKKFGISYLDITGYCLDNEIDIHSITRDGVHSNISGAILYSELISSEITRLLKLNNILEKIDFDLTDENKLKIYNQVIGSNISINESQALKISFNFDNISSKYNETNFELWALQVVGPHSPIIRVECSEIDYLSEFTIWDEWSYYKRIAFKPIIPKVIVNNSYDNLNFVISISDKTPDYQNCKDQEFVFNQEKNLWLTNNIFSLNVPFYYSIS